MENALWSFISQNERFREMSASEQRDFLANRNLLFLLSPYIEDNKKSAAITKVMTALQKQRNQALKDEMEYIHKGLWAAGIRVIFLKGPLLGEMIYDLPEIRTTSDIDILIDLSKAPQTFEALGRLGYYYENNGDQYLTAEDYTRYIKMSPYHTFIGNHFMDSYHRKGNQRYELEVHFTPFATTPAISVDEHKALSKKLFEHAVGVPCGTSNVLVLEPHDLIIQLSYHLVRHLWMNLCHGVCVKSNDEKSDISLSHFHDVALVIAKYREIINAKMLAGKAQEYGCSFILLFVLSILKQIYGLDLYDKTKPYINALNMDINNKICSAAERVITAESLMFMPNRELIYALRLGLEPVVQYHCAHGFEEADKVYCGRSANMKQDGSFSCFYWSAAILGNDDLYIRLTLNEDETQFIEKDGTSAFNIFPIFSFAAPDCMKVQTHCAVVYELSIKKEEGVPLFELVTKNVDCKTVDRNLYRCDIEYTGGRIHIDVRLKRSLFCQKVFDGNKTYFNIACRVDSDFTVNKALISWNGQILSTAKVCIFNGLLIL